MASAADPAHGPTGGKGPGRVEPVPGIPPQADVALLPVENPKLLTLGVMTASLLQVLDSTIANVAIPHMQSALGGGAPAAASAPAAAPAVGVRPEDVMATLEKLGELKAKGILTDDEFNTKKAELLKKLV